MIRSAYKLLRARLLSAPSYSLITHKFYAGQGATLSLNLTKRAYEVTFQTIWEDHCLVEIDGLTGIKNYHFEEAGMECAINDSELDSNTKETITMKLKIPEDFNYVARVHGRMQHVNAALPAKMRSHGALLIQLLGPNSSYVAGNLQAVEAKVQAAVVEIGQLLVGRAFVTCNDFKASKLSIAEKLELKAANTIMIRSLIMQDGESTLTSKHCEVESIMGRAIIDSSMSLKIKRWYAPKEGIRAFSNNYSIGVETGSGTIEGTGNVTLGRLQKGSKRQLPDGTVRILEG